MNRREKIEVEVKRIERQLGSLERDWARIPYLLLTLLISVPVGLVWGRGAAQLVVLSAVALVGTAFYLVGVRRREYQGELEELRHDLERLDRAEKGTPL